MDGNGGCVFALTWPVGKWFHENKGLDAEPYTVIDVGITPAIDTFPTVWQGRELFVAGARRLLDPNEN